MKLKNDWSKEYSQDGELPGPRRDEQVSKWLKANAHHIRFIAGLQLINLVWSLCISLVLVGIAHTALEWGMFWCFIVTDVLIAGIWLVS